MNTQRITFGALAALALFTTSSMAWAGARSTFTYHAFVDHRGVGFGTAELTNIRQSGDSVTWAACSVYGEAGGYEYASCWIAGMNNYSVSCWTEEPDLVDAARDISEASRFYIAFGADSVCTTLRVYHDSAYL
ncbi:MAG: hypothetical protein H6741_21280 [Alphaproteobacteria bacterium]|nr:hypothetical protein [Alphaproteobacteria bacterium]